MKYHIKFNTYFPLLSLPIVFYAVSNYGAFGAGVVWFVIQLISFLVWPPFIHSKFAKGIHQDWILKDILPTLIITIVYLLLLKYINIDFSQYSRLMTFIFLIGLGILLLCINALTLPNIRKKIKL